MPERFPVEPQTHSLTQAATGTILAATEPTPAMQIESTPSFSTPTPATIATFKVDSLT